MARRSRVVEEVEPEEIEDAAGNVEEVAQESPDQMESMSVAELNALIERATAARDGKIGAERQSFIDRIRAEAEGLGLSMQNLMTPAAKPLKKTSTGREPAVVKYRNGDQTWTGRGRLPTWLTKMESEGHTRDEFLVK